jgi:hypothetical protein
MCFLCDRVSVSAKKEADVTELQIGVKVNYYFDLRAVYSRSCVDFE